MLTLSTLQLSQSRSLVELHTINYQGLSCVETLLHLSKLILNNSITTLHNQLTRGACLALDEFQIVIATTQKPCYTFNEDCEQE